MPNNSHTSQITNLLKIIKKIFKRIMKILRKFETSGQLYTRNVIFKTVLLKNDTQFEIKFDLMLYLTLE